MALVGVFFPMMAAGVLFVELFRRLDTLSEIRPLIGCAPAAARIMRSPQLTDEQKEKRIRALSLSVLRTTLIFTVKFALIVSACVLVYLGSGWLLKQTPDVMLMQLWSLPALASLLLVALYAQIRHGHANHG